jgi:hypothetical protein
MTEPAVIVAGAVDLTRHHAQRTRHREHQGDSRSGKSTIFGSVCTKFTHVLLASFFLATRFCSVFYGLGPYGQMVLGSHFVLLLQLRKLQRELTCCFFSFFLPFSL